jgi:hypothetical protein
MKLFAVPFYKFDLIDTLHTKGLAEIMFGVSSTSKQLLFGAVLCYRAPLRMNKETVYVKQSAIFA